jgi:hypothetical protein
MFEHFCLGVITSDSIKKERERERPEGRGEELGVGMEGVVNREGYWESKGKRK